MLPDPAGPDADRRQQKGDVMARLVLRLKQVLAPTGLPRSTIFVLQQQGIFPQSIKLGSKATGWYEDEGARAALYPHLRLDKLVSAVYTSRHDDPEPDFADPACT